MATDQQTMEQVTLWTEGESKLFYGIAEIIDKASMVTGEPTFVLGMPYSDMKAEVIRPDIGSRYHYFRISSELNDRAATFWPYQFWLLSVGVSPEIVLEGEFQWMYLRFRVEEFPREVDFPLITCGPWDTYIYRLGVKGRY